MTLVVVALVSFATVALLYFTGPGWLPHSECPFCCWCSGVEPLGDRLERRVVRALFGGESP